MLCVGVVDSLVLACRIEPIIMSAGELEHEWAGTPGRLIRERYRKAAEVSRVRAPTASACCRQLFMHVATFKIVKLLLLHPCIACA